MLGAPHRQVPDRVTAPTAPTRCPEGDASADCSLQVRHRARRPAAPVSFSVQLPHTRQSLPRNRIAPRTPTEEGRVTTERRRFIVKAGGAVAAVAAAAIVEAPNVIAQPKGQGRM